MRLISWNVNGLRAVLKKGFAEVFETFDADVFALQETKCQAGQVSLDLPEYCQYFSYAQKKGYSGTALFCKERPIRVLHGLGNDGLDDEGRIVAAEFKAYWVVNVYTPNAQNELARIDHRMEWDDAFRAFCQGLEEGVLPGGVEVEYPGGSDRPVAAASVAVDVDAAGAAAGADMAGAGTGVDAVRGVDEEGVCALRTREGEACEPKPVVMCGDFNVAHQEIDLKNPGPNRGNAGFSDEEREKFQELLDAGFVDTFRMLHPDVTGAYSWWSYRFKARQNNAGWRIDYFLVSRQAIDAVQSASIFGEVMGSDHCPVGIELAL